MESLPDVSIIFDKLQPMFCQHVFLYSVVFSVLYVLFPIYMGNYFTYRKTVTNVTSTSRTCDPGILMKLC